MDTEPTLEAQLLAEAKKQTAAIESLSWTAKCWSVAAVLVFVIWVIVAINSGR